MKGGPGAWSSGWLAGWRVGEAGGCAAASTQPWSQSCPALPCAACLPLHRTAAEAAPSPPPLPPRSRRVSQQGAVAVVCPQVAMVVPDPALHGRRVADSTTSAGTPGLVQRPGRAFPHAAALPLLKQAAHAAQTGSACRPRWKWWTGGRGALPPCQASCLPNTLQPQADGAVHLRYLPPSPGSP